MPRTKEDWEALVTAVNELHSIIQRKPKRFRRALQLTPDGILNAYREGDISFDKAVHELNEWKHR